MSKWLLSIIVLFIPLVSLAQTSSIVITEIAATLPSNQEWIEIYNTTNQTIDITDWRFVEGITPSNPDGTRHSLKSVRGDLSINAGEYAVIANSVDDFLSVYKGYEGTLIDSSWSSLKEEGELVWLEDATGAIVEKFTYAPVADGVLSRIDVYTEDYTAKNWVAIPVGGTPGRKNEIGNIAPAPPVAADTTKTPDDTGNNTMNDVPNSAPVKANVSPAPVNEPPSARAGEDRLVEVGKTVSFDGSASFDTEGTALSYSWNFGDESTVVEGKIVTHQFKKEGDYVVRLKVSDGALYDEDKLSVTVWETKGTPSKNDTDHSTSGFSAQTPAYDAPPIASDHTRVNGIVLVEPGILTNTWFFIRSSDGTPMQVYSSTSEFQKMYIGQEVEVKGEMSVYKSVSRIKISSPEDIRVIAPGDPPQSIAVQLKDINKTPLGELISVSGEIVKEDGNIFIMNSSGERLRVEIKDKTGIDKRSIAEGARVTLAGILDKTQSGFRLQPRYSADVSIVQAAIKQPAAKNREKKAMEEEVKGDKTEETQTIIDSLPFESVSDTVNIPLPADKKSVVYKYLVTTAAAFLIVLVGLQIKKWKSDS